MDKAISCGAEPQAGVAPRRDVAEAVSTKAMLMFHLFRDSMLFPAIKISSRFPGALTRPRPSSRCLGVLVALSLGTASTARAGAAPTSGKASSGKMGSSGTRSGPLASAVSHGESYVLGAGDSLRVTVSGSPEYSQEAVMIPPDGVVTLPNFGTVRLNGKTRLGVQRELTARLRASVGLRNPALSVSIIGFRSNLIGSVVLAGDVPRSGTFAIRVGYRLSDLLADSGLQVRLEERTAILTRRSGNIPLRLKAAAAAPRGIADIVLRPGDSITVRQLQPGRITLQGDLIRSGVYEIHPVPQGGDAMEIGLAPRLSDLITKAGGLRSQDQSVLTALSSAAGAVAGGQSLSEASSVMASAAARATYSGFLQRGSRRIPLNPESAQKEHSGLANIRLLPGDVVTIEVVPPPQPLTVYLEGLSTRTGAFQVTPGTGILELITQAGGLSRPPGEIIARVRRGAQFLPLDLTKLLLSGESSANIKLESGDIVQLREPETIEVQVTGRFTKTGPLQLKPGSTILDALLKSGGLSIPADQARLNVLRREAGGPGQLLSADAAGIVGFRDISTNFTLRDGDVLSVAENEIQTVNISGEVNTPNSFQLRPGEGLPELIIRAGGAKSDAALTRISVTRRGDATRKAEIFSVDAYDAIKAGKPLDFALQDGDYVVILPNKDQVLVMEAVAKPGYYPIPERGRLTLLDLLAQAGPQPNSKTVQITRLNLDGSVDLTTQPRTISLDELRRGKTPNVDLSPRDVVFVPTAKAPRNFLQTLSSLSVFRLFLP